MAIKSKKKKKNHQKQYLGVAGVLLMATLTGCGSTGVSGGDTPGADVVGLAVADQVSLVTAADSGASSSVSALSTLFRNKFSAPVTGDFVDDIATTYVYDESMKPLDMINEILCYFGQTGYSDMVNQGNYLALVDSALCQQGSDQSGASNNQSSSQAQSYEEWVINSSRADDNSPQVVEVWVPQDGNSDGFDEIRVRLTITGAVSSENPFGLFHMDIGMYASGSLYGSGYLESDLDADGNVNLQMLMSTPGGEMNQQVHAVLDPDGVSGHAYVLDASMHGGGETSGVSGLRTKTTVESDPTQVAFDEGHYFASNSTEDRCLDRQNFNENVWEYNLYDADGNRKELNGGFPIKFGNFHGFASSWGVWMDSDASLSNGDTVTNDDGSTSYTYYEAAGRLVKQTRKELTLGDFEQDTFYRWDNEAFENTKVKWTGTEFQQIATEDCGEGGCLFSVLETPETLLLNPGDYLNLYKDGFGSINIVVPDEGLSNSLRVPYYSQETVLPGDALFASGDLTFKCYTNCVRGGLTPEQVNSGDLFLENSYDVDAPHLYVLNAETLALTQDGEPVSVDGLDMSLTPYTWGMMVSNLVLSTDSLTDFSDLFTLPETYSYETGPNSWNKVNALLDSEGNAVTFDQPLSCLYDDEDHGTFFLDYQGTGRLFGIPWEEDENEATGFSRWHPAFRIADGAEVTCGETTYYVKATNIEQSMIAVDPIICADLTVGAVAAPDGTFTDPEMGARPEVTGGAAVVGGEIQ
ncbi:MAG: hypothetical protein IPJ69_06490 [Deltaproteobacteria bacterium]|nr:MAG: hypothetical protein IPJ69_06490 [Deltaproteobacteria bacterium]